MARGNRLYKKLYTGQNAEHTMITEHRFLQALEEKNCAVVREILAHHPISLTVWQNALDHFSSIDDKQMICALVEHIDVNSMSQDTAVLCVSHRIDSVIDQIVQNTDLNHCVRQQFAFVISVNQLLSIDDGQLLGLSSAQKSLQYMDQRVSAVQKYTIEQHLSDPKCSAQPKRL